MPKLEMTLTRKSAVGNTVGVDLDSDSVAAAEPAIDGGLRAAVQPLPAGAFSGGEITDPDAVSAALAELFERNSFPRQVRLAVASQGAAFRVLRLPLIENPEQLKNAVRFQAGEQIPMPLESAVLDHQVIAAHVDGDGGRHIDVAVVAARRESVETILRVARAARLDPVGIDLAAFGMIRALATEAAPPETAIGPGPEVDGEGSSYVSATLYCSLGGITNLAISQGSACLFSRVAQFSVRGIAEELASETGLPLEHAEQWLLHAGLALPLDQVSGDPGAAAASRRALEANAGRLADELRLSLDYYGAQEGATPVEDIVLCGWGSAIPGLGDRLGDELGRAVAVGRPPVLGTFADREAARLVVPYGLSLER
jgi:type IV pilus assembly protein PilM